MGHVNIWRKWTGFIATWGLAVVVFWPAHHRFGLAPGQYKSAYFQPLGDRIGLVLARSWNGFGLPTVDVEPSGELLVPTGRSIAVRLDDNVTYVVTNPFQRLAPYVVIGPEEPAPALTFDSRDEVSSMPEGAILDLAGTGIHLRPWDGSRRWSDDRNWLDTLTKGCVRGGMDEKSLPLNISRQGDRISFQLGRCILDAPLARTNRPLLLALLAGPDVLLVARKPGGWTLAPPLFLIVILLVMNGLVQRALSPAQSLTAWICMAVIGHWFPAAGELIGALLIGGALIFSFVRASLKMIRRRFPASRVGYFATAMLIAGTPAVIIGLSSLYYLAVAHGPRRPQSDRRSTSNAALIGYSTVNASGLLAGTPDMLAYLDQSCPATRGSIVRYGRSAGTFEFIRDSVCSDALSVNPGGTVIFFGGDNDDDDSGASTIGKTLQILAGLSLMTLGELTPAQWRKMAETSWPDTLLAFDSQARIIQQTLACARAREWHFLFVHDFFIWDLDGRLAPPRQEMRQKRQALVTGAGESFADLYDTFGSRAGVSWFNDPVHFSVIGHRAIGELICSRLSM